MCSDDTSTRTFEEQFRHEQQFLRDALSAEISPRRTRDQSDMGGTDVTETYRSRQNKLGILDEDIRQAFERRREAAEYKSFQSRECEYPGQEPYVEFNGADHVGLALSGGGIRSATFNLGLLQALNRLNLLPQLDYLSTVSGGCYIGGWWSAWRHRMTSSADELFPKGRHGREPEEIRHLREFSNFLAPRLGVFRVDLWHGVIAVVSGMLPTLDGELPVAGGDPDVGVSSVSIAASHY